MRDVLSSAIRDTLSSLGVDPPSEVHLERPARREHADRGVQRPQTGAMRRTGGRTSAGCYESVPVNLAPDTVERVLVSTATRSERAPFPAGYMTLWTTVALDLVGFGIIVPILGRYAERFGANGFQVGLLFASYSLAQLLFAPLLPAYHHAQLTLRVVGLGEAGASPLPHIAVLVAFSVACFAFARRRLARA